MGICQNSIQLNKDIIEVTDFGAKEEGFTVSVHLETKTEILVE